MSFSSLQNRYCGDNFTVDNGAMAMMRCENVVLLVVFEEPPPTFTPLANVPTVPPMPNAPVIAPRFTLPPPEDVLDVVVDDGM